MSHGEALMLRVAFDVWNGRGEAKVGELLGVLDGTNLRALGSLLLALADPRGSAAIDDWIAVRSRPLAAFAPPPRTSPADTKR